MTEQLAIDLAWDICHVLASPCSSRSIRCQGWFPCLLFIYFILDLQARRDTPVDVQVGPFLWEDAPQELRSRLWIALLSNPHLIGNLVEEKVRPSGSDN